MQANQCDPGDDCEPLDCAAAGAECGMVGDGCDGTVDCGPCPVGEVCGIETPFKCGPPPPCTKLTCAAVGAQCGLIGDGCDGTVDCGDCANGAECGTDQPNKCSAVK
ncbi:MAG TPA: hypothetical protein VM686_04505 [Polyangiaceae bacterium]|nr:hypothetical protein [Polyangiaceae bacterium]